jgi:hypothetical protein
VEPAAVVWVVREEHVAGRDAREARADDADRLRARAKRNGTVDAFATIRPSAS